MPGFSYVRFRGVIATRSLRCTFPVRLCERPDYANDRTMRTAGFSEQPYHANDRTMRTDGFCERPDYANGQTMRITRLCERPDYANGRILRTTRLCERPEYANDQSMRTTGLCERPCSIPDESICSDASQGVTPLRPPRPHRTTFDPLVCSARPPTQPGRPFFFLSALFLHALFI